MYSGHPSSSHWQACKSMLILDGCFIRAISFQYLVAVLLHVYSNYKDWVILTLLPNLNPCYLILSVLSTVK